MLDRRKFIKETALTTGVIFSASMLPLEAEQETYLDDGKMIHPPAGVFQHGVASGDPMDTQAIIWTRVTSEQSEAELLITWHVSKDPSMVPVEQSGQKRTNGAIDYTVKVDVDNLSPATSYYYQFVYKDTRSVIGRTRTAPGATSAEPLEFAVISCMDYSAGFYNALARIAQRSSLQGVIHLGDYIYEGTGRAFDERNNVPDDGYESTHFVKHRAYWLHYFRRRYSINRLDADLQQAHQQHPFITIWDDHETSNNAYKDGAKGHDPANDGEWEDRKSAARQAYFEWLPIRGDGTNIYRTIRFGNLMELILLDTRLEGRDKQIYNPSDPARFAADRTLLGKEQKDWMFRKLKSSPCQWKMIANQVIFSEINVQWASGLGPLGSKLKEFNETLLDYWEGYPAERDEVVRFISQQKISNAVILSASMHCALAFDVTMRPTRYSRKGESATYDPATGNGSVAVEFAAPSVTSANIDEQAGPVMAGAFERMINRKLPQPINYNANPHMKFVDVQRHGYFTLRVSKERVEAGYYFMKQLFRRDLSEEFAGAWVVRDGSGRLERGKV